MFFFRRGLAVGSLWVRCGLDAVQRVARRRTASGTLAALQRAAGHSPHFAADRWLIDSILTAQQG